MRLTFRVRGEAGNFNIPSARGGMGRGSSQGCSSLVHEIERAARFTAAFTRDRKIDSRFPIVKATASDVLEIDERVGKESNDGYK